MRVDGDLSLNNNQLRTLPKAIRQMRVGGEVDLGDNPLAADKSRPKFAGLKVVWRTNPAASEAPPARLATGFL